MEEIKTHQSDLEENRTINDPEIASRSWLQHIRRFVKKRVLAIATLASIATHTGIAASGTFAPDTPLIKLKAELPNGIINPEKEQLIELLENDDKLVEKIGDENAKKVADKKAERGPRIDPQKVETHKHDVREQLLKHKKIRFADFFEKQELLAMGIDPEIIQKGKAYFQKQIAELKKEKGELTNEELLQKVANLINDKEEDYTAVDDTETSVFEYLASQADAAEKDTAVLKATCETRWKKAAMAVEELFPGKQDKIFYQMLDKHIRAGFQLNKDKQYAIERGKLIPLTEQNSAGTLINNARRKQELYAGLHTDPLKLKPGNFTPGKPLRIEQFSDGLGEPLPDGVQLASPTDHPSQVFVNWNKTVGKIEDRVSEIEELESKERAKQGITDIVQIVPALESGPEAFTKFLESLEKENLEKGQDRNGIRIDAIMTPNEIKSLNQWSGKLPIAVVYDSDILSFFSADALKDVAKTTADKLEIHLDSNALPQPFIDALDPCELKSRTLMIVAGKNGRLPPDQLKKILSCNQENPFAEGKLAVYLVDYDLNEEEAKIIADVNKGGIWLQPGEITYGDNILDILASTTAYLHIAVETKNQRNKYKRQSPWFFGENGERNYYAYMYSLEEYLELTGGGEWAK